MLPHRSSRRGDDANGLVGSVDDVVFRASPGDFKRSFARGEGIFLGGLYLHDEGAAAASDEDIKAVFGLMHVKHKGLHRAQGAHDGGLVAIDSRDGVEHGVS